MAKRLKQPLRLQINGGDVTISGDMASAFITLRSFDLVEGVVITALPGSQWRDQEAEPKIGAVSIPDAVWRRFDVLAALTYVPPSERSRLTGAGAGLSDND